MQRLSGFICVFLPSKDDRQCAGISTGFLSGFSIAVVIHSFDCSLQEINPKGWCAVRTLHIAIALLIQSLDRSLQEINPKGWCAVRTLHIAIALLNQSVESHPTNALQMHKVELSESEES